MEFIFELIFNEPAGERILLILLIGTTLWANRQIMTMKDSVATEAHDIRGLIHRARESVEKRLVYISARVNGKPK